MLHPMLFCILRYFMVLSRRDCSQVSLYSLSESGTQQPPWLQLLQSWGDRCITMRVCGELLWAKYEAGGPGQSSGSRDGGTWATLELFLVVELAGFSDWSHVGVM